MPSVAPVEVEENIVTLDDAGRLGFSKPNIYVIEKAAIDWEGVSTVWEKFGALINA